MRIRCLLSDRISAWTNRQWSKGIRANHLVRDGRTERLLITSTQAATAVMDGVGASGATAHQLICPSDKFILFRWCGGRRDGRYSTRTCTTSIGSKRQHIWRPCSLFIHCSVVSSTKSSTRGASMVAGIFSSSSAVLIGTEESTLGRSTSTGGRSLVDNRYFYLEGANTMIIVVITVPCSDLFFFARFSVTITRVSLCPTAGTATRSSQILLHKDCGFFSRLELSNDFPLGLDLVTELPLAHPILGLGHGTPSPRDLWCQRYESVETVNVRQSSADWAHSLNSLGCRIVDCRGSVASARLADSYISMT